jgi:membrane-associated phospholipid phosphatase
MTTAETQAENALLKRVALTLCAVGVFGLYVLTNQLARQSGIAATQLETALDRAIPFWPPAILIYVAVYLFLFLPVVQIKDMRVFTRVAIAFYVYNSATLLVFYFFPVTVPRPLAFDTSGLWGWGVAMNYHLDPPFNCFPSLHVSNAVFCGLVAWRLERVVGAIALVTTALICLSTLLIKQHWIADVLAGSALGAARYWGIVRPPIPL